MRVADFSFELPESLIAHYPQGERSACRLLQLDGPSGALTHGVFTDLLDKLEAGDLLVFNNTRVIPARMFGRKVSGGKIEVLVERVLDDHRVLAPGLVEGRGAQERGHPGDNDQQLATAVVERITEPKLHQRRAGGTHERSGEHTEAADREQRCPNRVAERSQLDRAADAYVQQVSEAIAGGTDLLCIGEMGIGNTTAAIDNVIIGKRRSTPQRSVVSK